MPFDSRDVASLELVFPASYHPLAPCVPMAPSRGLRIAYAFARHHGQLCWMSNPGMSLQRPDLQRNNIQETVSSTTYARLGAGYHWLTPQTTHLSGIALFAFAAVLANQTFTARMVVTDGTNTDVGGLVRFTGDASDPGNPNLVGRLRNTLTVSQGAGPYEDGYPGNAVARVEVTRLNVPTGQIVRSYIEAFAIFNVGFAGAATPIKPQLSMAFAETRG